MLGGDPPLSLSNSLTNHIDADAILEGHRCPVRWKLLIITSLVAALLSAGGMYVFTFLTAAYVTAFNKLFPLYPGLLIVFSLAVNALAFVFVYRHTARRRKLQAALTVLLTIILTAIIVATLAWTVFAYGIEVGARPAAPAHRGAPA